MGSFILLSLLPLLVTGFISFHESNKSIEKNTRIFSTEIVKQVAKNVQLQMAQVATDSEALVLSDQVQSALTRYAGTDDAEQGRARLEMTKILLDAYGSFDYFNQKYFLDNANRIVDMQVFPQLSEAVVQTVERATGDKGRPHWTTLDVGDGEKSIVMLRSIYLKENGRHAGSLFLGINQLHFSAVFDNVDLGTGSDITIVDAVTGSLIIKRSRRTPNAATTPDQALLDDVRKSLALHRDDGFVIYDVTGADNRQGNPSGKFVAAYTQIPKTNWFVVSAIPYQNLLFEAQSVRNQFILIGLLCFVASILLAYLISRSISAPLEKLIDIMKQAQKGNYTIRMPREGRDELTTLSQHFNDMAREVAQEHDQLESRVFERTRDLEEANLKLATLSMTDSLTGIPNRRRFDLVLVTELQRATRSGTPLALMMIDVDYFKNYNDYYGHQEGDACLRKVACLIEGNARRSSDLVARYGGEEFVMLLPETDRISAMQLAESILASLVALNLPHARTPLTRKYVTASIGVAVAQPNEQHKPEDFIRMADRAMYSAKELGRNRVVLFGQSPGNSPGIF